MRDLQGEGVNQDEVRQYKNILVWIYIRVIFIE